MTPYLSIALCYNAGALMPGLNGIQKGKSHTK